MTKAETDKSHLSQTPELLIPESSPVRDAT